jgi:hypothetical protein
MRTDKIDEKREREKKKNLFYGLLKRKEKLFPYISDLHIFLYILHCKRERTFINLKF